MPLRKTGDHSRETFGAFRFHCGGPPVSTVLRYSTSSGADFSGGVSGYGVFAVRGAYTWDLGAVAAGSGTEQHLTRDYLKTTQSLQVRADSRTWLLAQYRRDALWKDGAHLPEAYPRSIEGGVSGRAHALPSFPVGGGRNGPLEANRMKGGGIRPGDGY